MYEQSQKDVSLHTLYTTYTLHTTHTQHAFDLPEA